MALGGVKLLVDVVAFAYPAYMSFKALETSTSVDDKQWYVRNGKCSFFDLLLAEYPLMFFVTG